MKKFAIILMLLTGCRADMPTLDEPKNWAADDSFEGAFQMFWHGMNNNYVFWSIDPTDWDAVYRTWQPRFAALDKQEDDQDAVETFHDYISEISSTLVDGHLTLTLCDDAQQPLAMRGKSGVIVPSKQRVERQWGAQASTPFWLQHPQEVASAWKSLSEDRHLENDSEQNFLVVALNIPAPNGRIIPYIYFSGFQLTQHYSQPEFRAVMDVFFNSIRLDNVAGAIIDVRGNGGGDTQDLNFLLGRFITQPLTFAQTRAKAGEGRLDYTPWVPFRIMPVEGANTDFRQPLVVITDMLSASCAEMTAMSVRAMPHGNGRVVGVTTMGAQGALTDNTSFNGGQFSTVDIINGKEFSAVIKSVYTASVMLREARTGEVWEGRGLKPDREVQLDVDQLAAGRDNQIEAAMEYINNLLSK